MTSPEVDPHQFTTPYALTPTVHRDPYPAISPDNKENSQKGKVVIITGGGTGIGRAAAKVWARAGAAGIVITGRRISALEAVSEEIKGIDPEAVVLCVQADISSEEDAKSLYAQVQKKFGKSADVLINNAGYLEPMVPVGEQKVDDWWKGFEINLKGLYIMIHSYIQAQPNPKEPVGTIITVSSGRAGLTLPGGSAYDISKLAEQRLVEHVQVEYPTLRMFSTMPGIVATEMSSSAAFWAPFALDHADLTGMLALYLVQPRADYLKGSMIGVNWDVLEMEKHKEDILEKKLLWASWLPILPVAGGKALSA